MLYTNDVTPTVGLTEADFTEANFSGYAPIDLDDGGAFWPAAAINGSNEAFITAAQTAWTHNGGGIDNNIYGWVMLNGEGVAIAGERLPYPPFAMDKLGKQTKITPTIKLKRAA